MYGHLELTCETCLSLSYEPLIILHALFRILDIYTCIFFWYPIMTLIKIKLKQDFCVERERAILFFKWEFNSAI